MKEKFITIILMIFSTLLCYNEILYMLTDGYSFKPIDRKARAYLSNFHPWSNSENYYYLNGLKLTEKMMHDEKLFKGIASKEGSFTVTKDVEDNYIVHYYLDVKAPIYLNGKKLKKKEQEVLSTITLEQIESVKRRRRLSLFWYSLEIKTK
jgi:ribulose-5-phosphate 4-epimerase/fuculose-1-phosphate aldolase